MRKGLFDELGVLVGPIRLELCAWLRPWSFVIDINHLPTLPRRGLPPATLMVNDNSERVRDALESVASRGNGRDSLPSLIETRTPGSEHLATLITPVYWERLAPTGLTKWDSWDHLVLCLASEARQLAPRLVTRSVVTQQVGALAERRPALAGVLRSATGYTRLTGILRQLVSEQVPINHLETLGGLLVEIDDRRVSFGVDVLDRRGAVQQVRDRIPHVISQLGTPDHETLLVFLVDAELEGLAERMAAASLDQWQEERVVAAVRAELTALPRTARVPPILTTREARSGMRRLLAAEFPLVRVLAYTEVPSHWLIQSVGRIAGGSAPDRRSASDPRVPLQRAH